MTVKHQQSDGVAELSLPQLLLCALSWRVASVGVLAAKEAEELA